MKKYMLAGIAILLICASIILSGYVIGDAIKSSDTSDLDNNLENGKVLNLSQVSKYLNMPEEQVTSIIQIESKQLSDYGSFFGKMLPYFTIDDTKYFYKDEIDEWLKEVASNHRIYDTKKGFTVQ